MIGKINKRYEVAITCKADSIEELALILFNSGYSVYLGDSDNTVCFTATEDDVTEVNNES